MNIEQLDHIKNGKGFIAALDQSGGSTPKALKAYGIEEGAYNSEEEMFSLIHQMRTRIIMSPAFSSEYILGAILFKQTMRQTIEGVGTADFLWQEKHIIPFLKIDDGLAEMSQGVQLMKSISELDELLQEAKDKHIFGTKERSVIHEYNEDGIRRVVKQQFEIARRVCATGLVPIIEPEVSIYAKEKSQIETFLAHMLKEALDGLSEEENVMLKLTLPSEDNLYESLTGHSRVVRVVALSGGYTREEANEKLSRNRGVIASFSRVLSDGLSVHQTDEEFTETLRASVESIYRASVEKRP